MPTILISNDDGIDSPLLQVLIPVFAELGRVVVAAPHREQSWVGKCMSRFATLEVEKRSDLPCEAYAITGSPADCVNLAIGHLLPEQPLCVVSGINVGHNAGLAYLLSSGTVGAALEGALHNIPAFAASLALQRSDYDRMKEDPRLLGEALGDKAQQAAVLYRDFVAKTLETETTAYGVVHKLNFPSAPLSDAKIVPCHPAPTQAGNFFRKHADGYRFAYEELVEHQPQSPTDRETLLAANVSYSRLDFSVLGRLK